MYRILACDDDPDILDVIDITFSSEGFEVFTAEDGQKAWDILQRIHVDVVIADYVMPNMDGVTLCSKIKNDPLLCQIPVLLVTGKGETEDKITGLRSGADDYIVKPFEPQELVLRVENLLKRTKLILDTNPLTHLPGNNAITEELNKFINSNKIFGVVYADLNHFKSYNDKYGFAAGDNAIKLTASIICEEVKKIDPNAFIGHIGGDDFVFITEQTEKIEQICENIIQKFDQIIPKLYDEQSVRIGYITTLNRNHQLEKFPLMKISLAIVTNERRKISHPGQLSQIAAEIKKKVKEMNKSAYLKDRRKD